MHTINRSHYHLFKTQPTPEWSHFSASNHSKTFIQNAHYALVLSVLLREADLIPTTISIIPPSLRVASLRVGIADDCRGIPLAAGNGASAPPICVWKVWYLPAGIPALKFGGICREEQGFLGTMVLMWVLFAFTRIVKVDWRCASRLKGAMMPAVVDSRSVFEPIDTTVSLDST